MSVDLRLAASLLALREGRAVPFASHQRVRIQPHALLLAPLALAGEDTTVHALAMGRLGEEPRVAVVPDPRSRAHQYELLRWLGEELLRYADTCARASTWPQIWVSSGAAIEHLDVLADRLRFSRDPAIRRMGQQLAYHTLRQPVAGQQALFSVTGVLRQHFATGQQAAEDEHLAALLAWFDTRDPRPVLERVEEAERIPMGVKCDPAFDRTELAPLVSGWNQARRAGDDASMDQLAQAIRRLLTPVVKEIHAACRRGLSLLIARGLPELPELVQLAERERDAFRRFSVARDKGISSPLQDRPRSAAFQLTLREDAQEHYEIALLDDGVVWADAVRAGRVVEAELVAHQRRGARHRLTLVSAQPVLRARVGDTLFARHDTRLTLRVERVERRSDGHTELTCAVTAGMRKPGVPAVGTTLAWVPSKAAWSRIGMALGRLKGRTATLPWTHDVRSGPAGAPASSLSAPTDPLAILEAL